jgi:SAM-dependent methyltransferase
MGTISDAETRAYNREAWDRQVEQGNMWTRPVGPETIEAARRGAWTVVLTGLVPVPRDWFPAELAGKDVLCLASGGGQQGPTLAAAGANVTVFDNSPKQLERDQTLALRFELPLRTVLGDMADLSALADQSFDLVFHPVSNVFAADVRPVWREAWRVLRPGASLLAGFMNPAGFLFDYERFEETGERVVRYKLPYADSRDLPADELAARRERGEPLEFSHSLAAQIGGQLEAGFQLVGFYEHRREPPERSPLSIYMPEYIATRARRPLGSRRRGSGRSD